MQSSALPSCSVVVCTRSRPQELARCLAAVRAQDVEPVEVIVVDSAPEELPGPSNPTLAIAERFAARYVAEPQPGASAARNRGAHEARGEIVVYLDDDSAAYPDALGALLHEFSDDVVAVMGRALPPADDPAVRDLCNAMQGTSDVRVAADRSHPQWLELAAFGGLGNGMIMAIRSAAFKRWQGFDERLGPSTAFRGFEELYAYVQLIEQGGAVVYTPLARVVHPTTFDDRKMRSRAADAGARSVAFMLFLMQQMPRYRRRVLRYALEGLLGKRRAWRQSATEPSPDHAKAPSASRWSQLRQRLRGIALYLAWKKSQTRPAGAGLEAAPRWVRGR